MRLENKLDAEFSTTFSNTAVAKPTKRIWAVLINIVTLNVWVFLIALVNGSIISVLTHLNEDFANEMLIVLVILGCVSFWGMQFYFVFTRRQTLGKWLMKIQVVDCHSRMPVSVGRYLGRECVEALLYLFFFPLVVFSLIMLFRNTQRRTLSDLLFSSCVIEKT
ncbi:RDD family protein [Bibersteinia trehalosi]|uniref:RDD family protein n=1 Tax=Bibersteinia trehalosi TaxID=47735 RepID=UPI0040457D83